MKTTYANQKAITINRNLPTKGEKKKFLSAYYDNITQASRLLTGEVAFKLYLYLLSNQDKYVDNFSPQKFANDFGTSIDRTRRVFAQLEEAGYIVRTSANNYQFYETPQKVKQIVMKPVDEYRIAQYEDGTKAAISYNEYYNSLKDNYSLTEIDKSWNELPVVEKGETIW